MLLFPLLPMPPPPALPLPHLFISTSSLPLPHLFISTSSLPLPHLFISSSSKALPRPPLATSTTSAGRVGTGWGEMGWGEMGWGGIGWGGIGWGEMGWDGLRWDGVGWNGTGWGWVRWVEIASPAPNNPATSALDISTILPTCHVRCRLTRTKPACNFSSGRAVAIKPPVRLQLTQGLRFGSS